MHFWSDHFSLSHELGRLWQQTAARARLLDNRDLRPTLDLRSIFKAGLDERRRVDARTLINRVFPGSSGARPLQGLIRA